MAKAKGRPSAQQLKHDPLMDQYIATSTWMKGHSRPILKWLTVAAVVIALVAITWMFFSRRERNAGEALARAMAVHEAVVANPLPPNLPLGARAFTTEEEKHREAYKAFQEVASEYSSINGDLARYLGATHQLHFEADKAEATLKEISQKDSDVGAHARMALAGRYAVLGKNDEALAEYQKLKAKPGPIPPALIEINMARVYEAMGANQKAAELYFAVASNKDLRSTGLGSSAATRLAVLAPEKIEQLPPPETPTSPGGMPIQLR